MRHLEITKRWEVTLLYSTYELTIGLTSRSEGQRRIKVAFYFSFVYSSVSKQIFSVETYIHVSARELIKTRYYF